MLFADTSSFGFGFSRFNDSLSEAQGRREARVGQGCCTPSGDGLRRASLAFGQASGPLTGGNRRAGLPAGETRRPKSRHHGGRDDGATRVSVRSRIPALICESDRLGWPARAPVTIRRERGVGPIPCHLWHSSRRIEPRHWFWGFGPSSSAPCRRARRRSSPIIATFVRSFRTTAFIATVRTRTNAKGNSAWTCARRRLPSGPSFRANLPRVSWSGGFLRSTRTILCRRRSRTSH